MALRDINLVDPDILLRRYMLRHLVLWAGCLLVALVVIGGFYGFQLHAATAQKKSLTSIKQMHSDLAIKIEEIKRLQTEFKTLSKQQQALEAITKKPPFFRILLILSRIMNEDTWLTQLALDGDQGDESADQLDLVGFSRSNEHLGDFMNHLSAEPMFESVLLQFAKEGETAPDEQNSPEAMPPIQFKILCKVTRG
jgi:Tfp pilus assembly protein PilN